VPITTATPEITVQTFPAPPGDDLFTPQVVEFIEQISDDGRAAMTKIKPEDPGNRIPEHDLNHFDPLIQVKDLEEDKRFARHSAQLF
jgi:hypothetical protein